MRVRSRAVRKRSVAALLAVLLLMAAGCAGPAHPEAPPAEPPLPGAGPETLEAGGMFLFRHPGGMVSLHVEGQDAGAEVELYDPLDRRLARVTLGQGPGLLDHVEFPSIPRGEPVLVVFTLEGRLHVQADGRPVDTFVPLHLHLERVVLVDRPPQSDPLPSPPDPVDRTEEVHLQRTPLHLALRSSGAYEGLELVARGPLGPVLEAHGDRPSFPLAPLTAPALRVVPSEFHAANVRDGTLEIQVSARHLDGVLVLEAWSYSRARAPLHAVPENVTGVPRFTYGEVPDRPVWFPVHRDATRLVFQNPGDSDAWVALHGPDDARLATLRIPAGTGAAVSPAPGGGAHVAVALEGSVVLGSDRAPPDLDALHVLERVRTEAPQQEAGQGGRYVQESQSVEPSGVLYAVRHLSRGPDFLGTVQDPASLLQCSQGGTLRAVQDGETIGVWGDDVPEYGAAASLLLKPAPITLVHDGLGRACERHVLELWSYVRSS